MVMVKMLKCDFSKLIDSGNSIEIFHLQFLIIMIMMWGSFKSQTLD